MVEDSFTLMVLFQVLSGLALAVGVNILWVLLWIWEVAMTGLPYTLAKCRPLKCVLVYSAQPAGSFGLEPDAAHTWNT